MESCTNSDKLLNPKPKRKSSFIAVHLGAGEHSFKKKDAYKTICDAACSQGLKILRNGGSAGEAVAQAVKILEDSGIVNAGRGSNLTFEQTVECDAGFMEGEGYFGGVGAVPGVPNPILVAKRIAEVHKQEGLLSGGRVPPNFMVGQSAKLWTEKQGIPVCDDNELISKSAKKSYEKFMTMTEVNPGQNEVNDTIGAIALDNNGQVASAVSSGGNWLKLPGRIGHSPLFGCGCWSSVDSISRNAIAISASGAGEMLSRVRLPQECAREADTETNSGLVGSITSSIQKHILNNASLNIHREPRYVGLIALLWEGNHGEFVWGHTSSSFVIAYGSSKMRSIKMNFSELNENSTPGKTLKVEGVCL